MMILEMNILTLHLNGEFKKTIACVHDELNNQVTDDVCMYVMIQKMVIYIYFYVNIKI
jgi:hypothetical protein